MIVLDTHALFWSVTDRGRLSRRIVRAIATDADVLVPAICFWELAMLTLRGRINLGSRPYSDFITLAMAGSSARIQPLTPEIGLRAAGLSLNRPMDPADQLIAATALELSCPLVTADERLKALPGLQTLW
ncbi:MAG: type II toxin-antitoxin system VapC family toxin [Dehalococcoidia bacterium]